MHKLTFSWSVSPLARSILRTRVQGNGLTSGVNWLPKSKLNVTTTINKVHISNYSVCLRPPSRQRSTVLNENSIAIMKRVNYSTVTGTAPPPPPPVVEEYLGSTNEKGRRKVGWWLIGSAALVMGMVIVGGVTRLTESGLSITEWKPVVGAVPPLSQEDWEREFEKYKQFPEYKKLNKGMTLEEFKFIYFMEYSHRLLGRVIGAVFFFPLAYFMAKGYVRGKVAAQLFGLFTLGGLQGALGWYMVKSGLDENIIQDGVPRVSQYRLAAHMGSAVLIYVSLLWMGLNHLRPNSHFYPEATKVIAQLKRSRHMVNASLILSFITVISGAFVAGLDAGLIYNTFPLMGGQLVPENVWSEKYQPAIRNCTENDVTVQFQHRVLGITTYTVIAIAYAMSLRIHKNLPRSTRLAFHALFAAATTQVVLGISTLLTFVPVPLAAAHQSGAMTLLSIVVWLLHELRRLPK